MKQIESVFKGEVKHSLQHYWPKGYWHPIVNQVYEKPGEKIFNEKKDFDARFRVPQFELAMEFKVHRDLGRAFSLSRIPRHQLEGLRKGADAGMVPMILINIRVRGRDMCVAIYHPAEIMKMHRQGQKSIRFWDLEKCAFRIDGKRENKKKIWIFRPMLTGYLRSAAKITDWSASE